MAIGTSGRISRLALYPKCITSCSFEASKYALCVSNRDDLKKDDCRTEFNNLKNCFQKAMLISMGCCFSCFNRNDDKSLSGEPNERTTLLGNPVSNNISRPFSQEFPDSVSGHLGDEQAALNKILHQTAIDIIDVSAIPTHIEQKDYIDRVKLYQKRLVSMHLSHVKEKSLLKDLPLPEKILSEPSLFLADIRMMNDAASDLQTAMKSVMIEPKGDLVSKFGMS